MIGDAIIDDEEEGTLIYRVDDVSPFNLTVLVALQVIVLIMMSYSPSNVLVPLLYSTEILKVRNIQHTINKLPLLLCCNVKE